MRCGGNGVQGRTAGRRRPLPGRNLAPQRGRLRAGVPGTPFTQAGGCTTRGARRTPEGCLWRGCHNALTPQVGMRCGGSGVQGRIAGRRRPLPGRNLAPQRGRLRAGVPGTPFTQAGGCTTRCGRRTPGGFLWRGCHKSPRPHCDDLGVGEGNDTDAMGNGGVQATGRATAARTAAGRRATGRATAARTATGR
jgi:hypothetical protein